MKKTLLSVVISLLLPACGSAYRPQPIFSNVENLSSIDSVSCTPALCGWNPITWGERVLFKTPVQQINPYLFKPAGEETSLFQAARATSRCTASNISDVPAQLSKPEQARNELIGTTLLLADAAISEHLSDIKSTETNMNLIMGGATAALTGGASVAGTEGAKVLSAAATGTNAGRSMFNETTYRNALGETLTGSIETDRILKRDDILKRLKTECTSTYPVSIALADVQSYLDGGSFYHGLALIREAAEKANAKRRGEITLDDPIAKQFYDNQLLEQQNKGLALQISAQEQKKVLADKQKAANEAAANDANSVTQPVSH